MTLSLSIQSTYSTLDMALCKDDQIVEWISEDKIHASKSFIPLLSNLLRSNSCSLADLSFVAVNQGPGPFTTLRVVISSANGISFATQKPLIGINGLDALLLEYNNHIYPITVALLNAFGHDVYFGIQKQDQPSTIGCTNITTFLTTLKTNNPDQPIHFLGNGVSLHHEQIVQTFGHNAIIPPAIPHTCTVQQIGFMGFEKWKKQEGLTHQLFPLYLKQTMSA